jgi:hypothetical protein
MVLPRIAITLNRSAVNELAPATSSSPQKGKTPTSCWRALEWDDVVEQNYRVQQGGWRDAMEYIEHVDQPQCWPNGLLRCVKQKQTGFHQYYPKGRECDDGLVAQVKLYDYEEQQEGYAEGA